MAIRIVSRDDCIEWQGTRGKDGYGTLGGRGVHRIAYELATGKSIPLGGVILHSCDNPPCYFIGHLSLGTHAANAADRVMKGRHGHAGHEKKTHCPQGHPYDAENTYRHPPDARHVNGYRVCRTCWKASYKRFQLRRVA